MKNKLTVRIVVYGVIFFFVFLGGLAWWHYLRVERAYANASLSREISDIVLCSQLLRLLEEGREVTALKFLESRIEDSANSAHELQGYGGKLYPGAYPNLRKGLADAADSARRKGRLDLADRIESLMNLFGKS